MTVSIRIFSIIAFFAFMLPDIFAETEYFTEYTKTNIYHQYIGKVSLEVGNIENNQDEVGVFVTDNNSGGLLIGACRIGENYPGYYFVTIYANDQSTIKNGAYVDDILTFKIWDKSHNKLYVLSNTNSLTPESGIGLTYPELPPVFKSGFGAQFGYLNLFARNQDLNENIAYFKAIPQQDGIKLIWSTYCEINLIAFLIFRNSTDDNNYINISTNMIQAKGNELHGADYCYIDNDVLSTIYYNYQLIGIDYNDHQTLIQTITDKSICQSCPVHMDLNGDNIFGLADIIELMKRISH